ncbi:MAG: O-antigen ligase family protein, partial [Cyclobacteriaceae bacterium]
HPTYFSVYIIFCITILIIGYRNHFLNRRLSLCLVVYFTAFLALLSTRITIVAILIASVFGLVYFLSKISANNIKKFAFAATLIILFVFLSALNPISLYRDFQEIRHSTYQIEPNTIHSNSTTIRLSLWWTGLVTASHVNSLVGAGTGDTQNEIQGTARTLSIQNILNSDDPHNQYLHTYISLGAIGIILLLGCYLIPIRKAINSQNILHILFIGLVTMVSFTESFLEAQKGIVFFVLFQSLFLGDHKKIATA